MDDVLSHCRHLPRVSFAAGDALLTEGDPPGKLYILISGEVQVSKGGIDVTRIGHPGALFGEMSVLLDLPASATVAAISAVETHVADDPATLIDADPAIARHAARLLAARLHAATTYIVDLKSQFSGQTGHMAMVDRVLDALLEGQPANRRLAAGAKDDPRL